MNAHVAVSIASFGLFSTALIVASFILGYWVGHDAKDESINELQRLRALFSHVGPATAGADSSSADERQQVRHSEVDVRHSDLRS